MLVWTGILVSGHLSDLAELFGSKRGWVITAQDARFLNITGRYPKLARHHTNGPLIDIHYAFERKWSKNRISERPEEGTAFVEAAEMVMNGDRFAWMTNVKKEGFEPIRCTRGK